MSQTSLRADVIAALPAEFTKGIDIWTAMGCWGRRSVKLVLLDLFKEGLVERKPEVTPGGTMVYLYRKARAS